MSVAFNFWVKYCSRAMFLENRLWMYNRLHLGQGVKLKIYEGVEEFIVIACDSQ